MQFTQHELVIEWLKEFGEITPAKMGGRIYKGHMFGSETPKRCRELRDRGILDSKGEGRFVKFYLKKIEPVVIKTNEEPVQGQMFEFNTRNY